MAQPHDIEDVLSSIRRLVANEGHGNQADTAEPSAEAAPESGLTDDGLAEVGTSAQAESESAPPPSTEEPEALILDPAQRVSDPEDPFQMIRSLTRQVQSVRSLAQQERDAMDAQHLMEQEDDEPPLEFKTRTDAADLDDDPVAEAAETVVETEADDDAPAGDQAAPEDYTEDTDYQPSLGAQTPVAAVDSTLSAIAQELGMGAATASHSVTAQAATMPNMQAWEAAMVSPTAQEAVAEVAAPAEPPFAETAEHARQPGYPPTSDTATSEDTGEDLPNPWGKEDTPSEPTPGARMDAILNAEAEANAAVDQAEAALAEGEAETADAPTVEKAADDDSAAAENTFAAEPSDDADAAPEPQVAPVFARTSKDRRDDAVSEAELEDLLDRDEAMREMVADIVRQELAGALGERITRNVRKLVRREIRALMSSGEFD